MDLKEYTPLLTAPKIKADFLEKYDGSSTFTQPEEEKKTLQIAEEPNNEAKKFRLSKMSKRSLFLLLSCSIGSFCAGCAFSVPGPFFPQMAEEKGVSSDVVGILFSIFELAFVVTSPIYGSYINQIGAKFMYVAGIFLGGSCVMLFGFLDKSPPGTPFIVLTFLCRVLQGVGMSAQLTAGLTITANEFQDHVATVYGLMETFQAIGLMVGPGIGGILYEIGGFGLPFFVVGGVCLLNAVLIFIGLPQPKESRTRVRGSILTLCYSPLVVIGALDLSVIAIGAGFLDPTLAVHLETFHLSPLLIGLMFVISPGIAAVLAPVWGYLTDKKNIQAPLIIMANAVCCIAFLLCGPCPWLTFLPFDLWTVGFGLVLYGLSFGGIVMPAIKCINKGAWELGFEDNIETYGLVSGIFISSYSVGAVLGPLLGGFLTERIGFRHSATIIAGIHLFMTIISIFFFLFRKAKRQRYCRISALPVNPECRNDQPRVDKVANNTLMPE